MSTGTGFAAFRLTRAVHVGFAYHGVTYRLAAEAGSETPATAAQTAILAIIFMSALLPLGVHRSRGAQNHFLAIIRAVIISHFTLFPQAEAFVRKAQSAVERRPYRGRETQIVTGFKGNAPCRTAGR